MKSLRHFYEKARKQISGDSMTGKKYRISQKPKFYASIISMKSKLEKLK